MLRVCVRVRVRAGVVVVVGWEGGRGRQAAINTSDSVHTVVHTAIQTATHASDAVHIAVHTAVQTCCGLAAGESRDRLGVHGTQRV